MPGLLCLAVADYIACVAQARTKFSRNETATALDFKNVGLA